MRFFHTPGNACKRLVSDSEQTSIDFCDPCTLWAEGYSSQVQDGIAALIAKSCADLSENVGQVDAAGSGKGRVEGYPDSLKPRPAGGSGLKILRVLQA